MGSAHLAAGHLHLSAHFFLKLSLFVLFLFVVEQVEQALSIRFRGYKINKDEKFMFCFIFLFVVEQVEQALSIRFRGYEEKQTEK